MDRLHLRVVGLGAGGHAKVLIDLIQLLANQEIVGLLDPKRQLWGTTVLGVPVLGDDTLLERLRGEGVSHAFIGVGGVGDTGPRRRLYNQAREHGFQLVSVVHPQAVVARSVAFGEGAQILAGAIVGAATTLGDNVLLNTGAIVDHECVIGDHVHIASGATLASAVRVGDGAHIGLGACVRQGIRIGANALIGAGAVVVFDVPDGVLAVGVPARAVRKVGR